MDEPKRPQPDYPRLARRVVLGHWRLVLAGFLLVAVPAAGWVVFTTEPIYEASAILFLVPDRADPAYLREFMTPEVSAVYLAILRSRSLAQGVAEALPRESRDELTKRIAFRDYLLVAMNAIHRLRGEEVVVYSPTEIAIRELQEARMGFHASKDGAVTITATAFSPRVAVDLANTYVETLLARSGSVARHQTRETRELLENLVGQARTSLADAQEAARKFQAQGSGPVALPDEVRLDMTKLAQLEAAVAEAQVNREIAEKRLAYLKGDRTANQLLAADTVAQPLRERLAHLEAKLAAIADKYTDRHPLMQATQAEVQEARERLRAALQPQQAPKPAGAALLKPFESAQLAKQMAALEVEIVSWQAKEQGFQQRIAGLKKALSAIGARENQYAELARAIETQQKLTGLLSEKLMAARISEQTQIRGIQVIDLASLPRRPSTKQPLKLLALALAGGLGLGLGLATIREHTLQIVETEEQAQEATGLPVLGSIPIARAPKEIASREPLQFTDEPALALSADACRAIRLALDAARSGRPLRSLLVTSPGVHEGKTTVVLNLAGVLLETSRRLLLIDADLRRPVLHRALGMPNERGFADMLHEGEAAWAGGFREVAPGLDFLPAGIKPANPSALLSSRQVAQVLDLARQRADLVLIDSPPVLAGSDSLPLATLVDGVLLVVRAGVTQRRALVRAKQQLDKLGAPLVGVVVNGLSRRDTRRYYAAYESYVSPSKSRGRSGQKRVRP
jgi:succinoglycan biosynthesis transport protein ExoP